MRSRGTDLSISEDQCDPCPGGSQMFGESSIEQSEDSRSAKLTGVPAP